VIVVGIFVFATVSRLALGLTPLPIRWALGVKRPETEADHSSPPSGEVTNAWSYTSTPTIVLRAWCLVKHRNVFTFAFIWVVLSRRLKVLFKFQFGKVKLPLYLTFTA